MRNKERIGKVLDLIQILWTNPNNQDLRFGQIVAMIDTKYIDEQNIDLFYVEDENLIETLKEMIYE